MLPFQNPDLPLEERLDDLLSRLTLDEKVDCLSTRPHVPRLGIRASGHVEGLHGLAQGGPAAWGKPVMTPTTTFPQAKGLAETWDPELVSAIAAVEAKECRHIFHHPSYERGGIVVRAPNADLGRDPRWGRTEECYGEDAYLAGVMTVAFVRLQGNHREFGKRRRCSSIFSPTATRTAARKARPISTIACCANTTRCPFARASCAAARAPTWPRTTRTTAFPARRTPSCSR